MQRIVSGRFGGRRLLALPRGLSGVRPSSERVRGAIFDSLGAAVEGACVVDLCAGTGGLGLEALSRGAAKALFIERDPRVVRFLRRQLAAFDVASVVEVVEADAARFVRSDPRIALADLIVCDPPWGQAALIADCVGALASSPHVRAGAQIIVEVAGRGAPGVPEGLELLRARSHGDAHLMFLRRRARSASPEPLCGARTPAGQGGALEGLTGHAAYGHAGKESSP